MSTRLSPNIKPHPTPPRQDAMVLRWGTLRHKLTDEDFFQICQQNGELRIEMTKEGDMIVMMPTGGEGGNRNFNLIGEFYVWVKTDSTGVGFDSSTGFKLPNDRPAFIRAIIYAHVMRGRTDRLCLVRVEDHDVSVGAYGNRAFAWEKAEDFGGGGRGQFDEAIQVDAALRYAVMVNEAHAVFDAGAAVRDFTEIVAA